MTLDAPMHRRAGLRLPGITKLAFKLFLTACLGIASAFACTSTWTDGNGNWSNSANWLGGVPTSSSDACINNGSTVTLDTTGNTGTLTVATGNGLNMGSQTLNVSGTTISNAGNISTSDGILQLGASNTTLSGGGTLSVSNGAWVQQSVPGLTLTNQDNLIQGDGQIGRNGLSLDNQASGTVNANNSSATLFLNGGGTVSNEGLLTASNNGTLSISNNVTNTGNITGNGGSVLINSTITGGTLNSINSGSIGTNGTATLNGVTISSGTNYNTGSVTNLVGTITNNGTLTSPNGFLVVSGGDVTLSGGGNVVLQTDAFIQQSVPNLTLHNVNNTIQGAGQIGVNGLALDNQAAGVINATGGTLSLTGPVTNAGLLKASTGGTLQISANVANTGANITANGGTVNISAGITGGTLTATSGGSIGTNGTATLNGVTVSSGTNYNTGSVTNLVGTITNNGTLTSPNGFLVVSGGDVTLTGGGKVVLQTDAFIQQSVPNLTLHNVNNTIQGAGQIGVNGLSLDNQASGVVNATGGTLTLSGPVTNAGLLEASATGTLQISANVANTGANIQANGGIVNISSTITGGTLSATGGGSIGTNGTATLNGVTISSGTNYNTGSVTNLVGTITNSGTLTSPNGFLVVTGGDVTLTGGGSIVLQTDAFIQQNVPNLTLHNVNNTIQGAGQIGVNGLAIDNQTAGVIKANAGSLLINGPLTNAGTLEADAGSTLHVSSPLNVSTYNAGTLQTGTYRVVSTVGSPGTIQLDALGSTGGEIVKSSANIILDGANANPIVDQANKNALSAFQDNLAGGSFTVQNGQSFTTTPTGGQDFQNEGRVLVADANSSFTTGGTANYVQDGANATTQVDGTLTAGGGNVNINAGTLLGTGTIVGNVFVGANGTISPGDPATNVILSDPPGPIQITGTYDQAGTFNELIGGTPGSGVFGQINGGSTGTLESGSTIDVSLINGFQVTGTESYLIIHTAGAITGQFTNVDFLNNTFGDTVTVDYSQEANGEIFLDVTAPSTSATPEPGEFLPLVGLVGALAIWKLRRKRATVA